MVGTNSRLQLKNYITRAETQGTIIEQFERRHQLCDPDNPRTMLDRIENFLVVAPPMFDQIERLLANGEFDYCRDTIWVFAGHCEIVGAGIVIPTCLTLARATYEYDQEPCLPLMAATKEEYTRLIETFNRIVEMEAELAEQQNLRDQRPAQGRNDDDDQ